MRFYARFACGNPHFHTSWYKISYDTRAKKRFLDKCDYITRLRLVLQTHTRQKTFHRTRIVMYYLCFPGKLKFLSCWDFWRSWLRSKKIYFTTNKKFILDFIFLNWFVPRVLLSQRYHFSPTLHFLYPRFIRILLLGGFWDR